MTAQTDRVLEQLRRWAADYEARRTDLRPQAPGARHRLSVGASHAGGRVRFRIHARFIFCGGAQPPPPQNAGDDQRQPPPGAGTPEPQASPAPTFPSAALFDVEEPADTAPTHFDQEAA